MNTRGKKSLVLDLKRPEAVEIVHRLVKTADVVVENFRPGVMARFGLDCKLLGVNPAIIYCAISGYGQTRALGGPPGLCAGDPCNSGYDLAQIAHTSWVRASAPDYCGIFMPTTGQHYAFGAINYCFGSAPRDRPRPDDRRIDARKHAVR